MAKKTNKPAWLLPRKVGKLKPMSTRNVVRRHLKEWNFDDDEDIEEKVERPTSWDKYKEKLARAKQLRESKKFYED